jgi:hypothetical protein
MFKGIKSFVSEQWHDVKGNAKWDFFKWGIRGCLMIPAGLAALVEFVGHAPWWEAVLVFVLGAIILFLIWVLVVWLFLRMGKQNGTSSSDAELEIERSPETKSLEISAIYIPVKGRRAADCVMEVNNPGCAVSGIKLKLLKIEPPMTGPELSADHDDPLPEDTYSTDQFDLRSIAYTFKDAPNNQLNDGEKGHMEIFRAWRAAKANNVTFLNNWKTNTGGRNSFTVSKEYVLTVELSAVGVSAKETQFKLLFSRHPLKPIFAIEKI